MTTPLTPATPIISISNLLLSLAFYQSDIDLMPQATPSINILEVAAKHLAGIKGASVAPENSAHYRGTLLHQEFRATGVEVASKNAC